MARIHPALLAIGLLWLTATSGEATEVHPEDPLAILVDSVEVFTELTVDVGVIQANAADGGVPDHSADPDNPDGGGTKRPFVARHIIYVWRTSQGRTDVVLTPASIRVIGSDGAVDLLSAVDLIDSLALDAIRVLVTLGYADCPTGSGDTVSAS